MQQRENLLWDMRPDRYRVAVPEKRQKIFKKKKKKTQKIHIFIIFSGGHSWK